MISDYALERAKKLYAMDIPPVEVPADIRFIWCDAANPCDINNLITVGTHQHSFFEIHFVFCGEAIYECDNRIMNISACKALFIAPDVPHRYVDKSDDLFKVALAFRIEGKREVKERLVSANGRIVEFSEDIVENVSSMLRQTEKNNIFSRHIISGRLAEVLSSLFDALEINLPDSTEACGDPRVKAAIEYIDRNKKRVLTCDDVARECGLSSKQLNRIFKSSKGISLYKYIIAEKVKLSEKILLRSEHSIKEISFMLGFTDESNFVSFFKRHCGISPGIYRRLNSQSDVKNKIV